MMNAFINKEIDKFQSVIEIPMNYFNSFKGEFLTSMYTFTPSSMPVNIFKTLPLVDNCIVIPTPVGLPLSLNLSAIITAHVHGSITPTQLPSLRELIFSRSLPDEIKVTADIKPR